MPLMIDRRHFLAAAGGAAVAAATPTVSWASPPARRDPLFRISLAEWSLHRTIGSGKISNMDFPRVAKEEFGIEGIEYVNQFFKDRAEDATYLQELKQRCADLGVESVLIMVDGEGQLGDANEQRRTKAVENHYKWVAAAKFLGCHSIRVNAGSQGSYQEQVERAAHPRMVKRTFWTDKSSGKDYLRETFTDAMILLAETYNKEGDRFPPNPKKEVIILDIFDRTASVKLIADDWIDYMHIVKLNGQWQLVNVLWQFSDSEQH